MANFHVVPRNDAVTHETRGDRCPCVVEVKTCSNEDSREGYDVWYYHRPIGVEEAMLLQLPLPAPEAEAKAA